MRFSTLALLVLVGCGADQQELRIDVRTDWVPVGEFGAFEVWLSNEDGEVMNRRLISADVDTDYVAGVNLTTFRVPKGTHRVHVALLTQSRTAVASRSAVADVRSRTAKTLIISRECADITCPADLECHGVRCVDPRCSPEDPEFCEGSCDDVTCERAPADCAGPPVCVAGICLDSPGTCSEGEYCQPELGCLRLPAGPGDAGPADGGPDAGPILNGVHVDSRAFASDQPLEAVAIDANGSRVCIGGAFFGSLDFGGAPITARFGPDLYLACFDAGSHAHSSSWESMSSIDRFYDLDVLDDGSVVMVAELRGAPEFDAALTATGNHSYLIRVDPDGTYRDARGFVGGSELASVVRVAATGEHIVAGSYRADAAGADFGDGTLPLLPETGAQSNLFVAAYDRDLLPLWAHSFGDRRFNETATSIAFVGNRVFVAGEFRDVAEDDTGTFTLEAIGGEPDVFVLAYDRLSGALVDAARLGDVNADRLGGMTVVDGALHLTGSFGGGERIGECMSGAAGFVIRWPNPEDLGTHECFAELPNPSFWRDIVAGPRGSILYAHDALGAVSFAGRSLPSDSADVFLGSFATDGAERWGQIYGSGVEHPKDIAVSGDSIFVFGEFEIGDTDFGGDVLMHVRSTDLFLLELSED